MGAFTSSQYDKIECGNIGPFYLTAFRILGDGSGDSIDTGYGTDLKAAWPATIDNAALTITNASGTVTFSAAVTSTKYIMLFVLHS